MLDMAGKPAVVIGGGSVALRKIKRLLTSGASITVISPDICSELCELWQTNTFTWKQKQFEAEDIADAFLIIAAANHKAVNRLVAAVTKPNQLLNVVDDPRAGNFHVPASLQRGKLTIAVGTDGASPHLAKNIRNQIGEQYGEEFIKYLQFLDTVRDFLLHCPSVSKTLKRALLEETADLTYMKSIEKQQSLLLYLHLLSFTSEAEIEQSILPSLIRIVK